MAYEPPVYVKQEVNEDGMELASALVPVIIITLIGLSSTCE